jgi:hypothetical protein
MGYELGIQEMGTLTAAASYTANQYDLVEINSTVDQAVLASVLGQSVMGVLTNDPASGEACSIAYAGVSRVRYGGTVAKGDLLVANASGRAVAASAGGQYVIGRALEAGANGEIGTMLITHAGPLPVTLWTIPVDLASITGAGDVVTGFVAPFKGRILNLTWTQGVPVTTASRAASLRAEIGGTDVDGGVVALTSATCTPLGALIADTAITGNNTFNTGALIDIEAFSVTAFAEGEGMLTVELAAF